MAVFVLSIPAGMTVRGDGHMAARQVRRPSSYASICITFFCATG